MTCVCGYSHGAHSITCTVIPAAMFLAERYGFSFGSWVDWILRGVEATDTDDGLVLMVADGNCALVAQPEIAIAEFEGFKTWGTIR